MNHFEYSSILHLLSQNTRIIVKIEKLSGVNRHLLVENSNGKILRLFFDGGIATWNILVRWYRKDFLLLTFKFIRAFDSISPPSDVCGNKV